MKIGFRSGATLVALSVICSGMTAGCNREKKETAQLLTDTVRSYQELHPKLAELKAALHGLHEDVETLAARVPAGADMRSRYFNADEVLGVLDAKLKWLSGEIENARRDLKKDQVVSLRVAIAQTANDMGQVNKVIVELTHERGRLQQVAALLQAPYERRLPTGYLVKAAKDGVESHLIDFIEDSDKKPDKSSWFDFDRLMFASAGADLDILGSRSQLDNVVQILRAYPDVKLEIGAFTDNKGAVASNKKLSAARAQAVRKVLIASGVNPDRLTAEGYGPRNPVCPANDTEACKARNRRIAALVTAK
jgi:outer membrane protein OmpA-like peptidoglycan-associated protein